MERVPHRSMCEPGWPVKQRCGPAFRLDLAGDEYGVPHRDPFEFPGTCPPGSPGALSVGTCRHGTKRISDVLTENARTPPQVLPPEMLAGRKLAAVPALFLCIPGCLAPTDAGASTLARVLAALAANQLVSALSVSMNIAETLSTGPVQQARRLQPGDQVVIGYTPDGIEVRATADTFGVMVSGAQAESLGAGVPPGFYPVGSTLFRLPPGEQYSIFMRGRDGAQLSEARTLLESRIDASIATTLVRIIDKDMAEIAGVALDIPAASTLGLVSATALGAVNSGEIVTSVRARYDPDATRSMIDLAMAEVARGANVSVDLAQAGTSIAHATQEIAAGGNAQTAQLMANIASNRMQIVGSIETLVAGQSLAVERLVSTAIGAVNGGAVGMRN